jgi:hypothetical protein
MNKIIVFSMMGVLAALPAFPQTSTAQVRVVHVSSDAPAVDILLDGNLAFQSLRYKDYTNYAAVPVGTHEIKVNVSGTSTTVLTTMVTLGTNAYTFYAMGKVAPAPGGRGLTLIGTGDNVSMPDSASVRVRVVHAASTAPAVDVYVTAPFAPLGDAPLLTNVPFTFGAASVTVPAADYQARVTPTGTTTVAINSGRVRFTGGTARTVVALDPPAEGAPFEFLVLNDVN